MEKRDYEVFDKAIGDRKDLQKIISKINLNQKLEASEFKKLSDFFESMPEGNGDKYYFNGYLHVYAGMNKTAIELFERGIELNNSRAMSYRAHMYLQGTGGDVDYQKAIQLYERAIGLNDPGAMNARAYMYQHRLGTDGKADYEAAIALYERAIALDDASAMHNRAYMYQEGLGGDGKPNYEAAAMLYDRAIALNNVTAMNHRAYMYQEGLGGDGKPNYEAAAMLYNRAITFNNVNAMNERAYLHIQGKGGSTDYQAAAALYDRAIQLDNVRAMKNRADMARSGMGGPIDYQAAIALYERAIALNDLNSVYARAKMHLRKEGTPHDSATGINQLLKVCIEAKDNKHLYNMAFGELKDQIYTAALTPYTKFKIKSFAPNLSTFYNNLNLQEKDAKSVVLPMLENMAKDKDLPIPEHIQVSYCAFLLKNKTEKLEELTNDQEVLELIGKAFSHLARQSISNNNFKEASEFYRRVPPVSSERVDACYHLAQEAYFDAKDAGETPDKAYLKAKPYLDEAIEKGDKSAMVFLKSIKHEIKKESKQISPRMWKSADETDQASTDITPTPKAFK